LPTRSSSAVRAISSRSAILRAVMSRLIPKVPMIRPSKSRSGCLLVLRVSSSPVCGRRCGSSVSLTAWPVRMIICSIAIEAATCSGVK
jgi:hypothetical protein